MKWVWIIYLCQTKSERTRMMKIFPRNIVPPDLGLKSIPDSPWTLHLITEICKSHNTCISIYVTHPSVLQKQPVPRYPSANLLPPPFSSFIHPSNSKFVAHSCSIFHPFCHGLSYCFISRKHAFWDDEHSTSSVLPASSPCTSLYS